MTLAALTLLLAVATADQTTLPRQPDKNPAEQQVSRGGTPTDPLFDRSLVATDDSSFIRQTLESSRQGVTEALAARAVLTDQGLRDAAAQIGEQNGKTSRVLEALAKRKGWPLPQVNPDRAGSLAPTSAARLNANFIIGQLSWHQNTIEQFRAQIAGKGDMELKKVLEQALPAYERNLKLLLTLKP